MDFISSQRREYDRGALRRSDLHENPMEQFSHWFEEAAACSSILEANAMTLSTASNNLEVTSRMVLLKGYDNTGFRFFTNTTSLKGTQISENPLVALLFYWAPLERQIKICGRATLLSRTQTEEYFQTRPSQSQLAAWASSQSKPLSSRRELEDRFHELEQHFKNQTIPTPSFWSGYLVAPHSMEFWQGRHNRLHDCFHYFKKENQWFIERLNP